MKTEITYHPESGDVVRVTKDGTESIWTIRRIRSSCDGWLDAEIFKDNKEDYIALYDLKWDACLSHWNVKLD